MEVVDVDPLAVLPVTAASASAAFARATDPSRDRVERREQLRSLRTTLASVRRLLDRCEQAATQLAAELDATRGGQACSAGWAVCQGCQGVPLSCSDGVGQCPRCERTVQLDRGRFACGEPTAVVLRDAIGTEQALCLSHAAAAMRHSACLKVVTASRPARAVLGEFAGHSCGISRHLPGLPHLYERPGGG